MYSRDLGHHLSFVKCSGEWRICYSVELVDEPPSPKPILDCSLEDRKLALEGLPILLEEIVKEAEAEASNLESALGAAAEAISTFKAIK